MSYRYLKIRSCKECPNLKDNSYSKPFCNPPGQLPKVLIMDLGHIPAECPLETEYDICTQIKTKFADQILEYLLPKRERASSAALGVLDSVIVMVRKMKEAK